MIVKDRSYDIYSYELKDIIRLTIDYAESQRHEFLTIEHFAYALLMWGHKYSHAFDSLSNGKKARLINIFKKHLSQFESVPQGRPYELEESQNWEEVLNLIDKSHKEHKAGDVKVHMAMFVAIISKFDPSKCFAAKVLNTVIKEEMPTFIVQLLVDSIKDPNIDVQDLVADVIGHLESEIRNMVGAEEKRVEKPTLHGEVRVIKGPAALEMLKKELQGKNVKLNVEDSDDNSDWEVNGMHQLRVDVLYPLGSKNNSRHKTYCRDRELDMMVTTMMRRDRSNIILVGESGVGKTQMGYAILELSTSKESPDFLRNAGIFELNLSGLMAGVQMKAEVDARVAAAMSAFTSDKAPKDIPVVIFIDDIHGFVSSRQSNDNIDIFGVLAPYAKMDHIHFVVTSSYEDFNKLQGTNKVVDTLFQKIEIKEPSLEDTKFIVSKVIPSYSKYHNVTYPSAVISEAVELAERHIGEQFFPAKVIDLLDEAGALTRATRAKNKENTTSKVKITSECLQRVIAIRTHKEKATSSAGKTTQQKYSMLLEELQGKIYGQDSALNEVVNSVLMGQAGLEDETKPIASLFFVGPTGVGKTEVAKSLANQLEVPLIRFDMSEFAEAHTIAKLIGSPAGYVGYDEGGLLTNAVRKSPSAVVLFDEIEKAHKDIYNILLQVMDYASLTDGKGVKASFRNTIIIFTSNAGAQYAKQASLGFASRVTEGDAMLSEVKKVFKPEFINRLSRIVVFNGMDKHMASLILDSRIKKLQEQVSRKNVTITFTDSAREWLLQKGYTPEYGAREMDRVISQYVKSQLSKEMLFGSLVKKGSKAVIDVVDDKIVIS